MYYLFKCVSGSMLDNLQAVSHLILKTLQHFLMPFIEEQEKYAEARPGFEPNFQ